MEYTENLKLFKYNPETDGKQVFSIDQALNYNWDILDKFSGFNIGDPIISLTATLKENEIWLEGAEVSKAAYAELYAVYGDTYGEASSPDNFVLPDFRNRSIWGSSDATFGYQSAALPNITGSFGNLLYGTPQGRAIIASASGCFRLVGNTKPSIESSSRREQGHESLSFSASNNSPIYQTDATVTPPSLRVRVKTRYK